MLVFSWIFAALVTVVNVVFTPVSPATLMIGEGRTVGMGLEQWATDHGGRYPADGEFPRALTQGNYLPGNRARNWYEADEPPCPLVGDPAAALPAGTPAPNGLRAGAILYHLHPGGSGYSLAVVVRRGERLVVMPVAPEP